MAAVPTQQELLDMLQSDHERFTRLIEHLSDEEQQTPFTPQGWSVRDFLAHMAHWKAATQMLLVAYTHDQPLPPQTPSGDEANEEDRQMNRARTLPQVRNDWEETHTRLQHLIVDELDDTRLQEKVRPPWSEEGDGSEPICTILVDICGHDVEHFELMEQYFEIGN